MRSGVRRSEDRRQEVWGQETGGQETGGLGTGGQGQEQAILRVQKWDPRPKWLRGGRGQEGQRTHSLFFVDSGG